MLVRVREGFPEPAVLEFVLRIRRGLLDLVHTLVDLVQGPEGLEYHRHATCIVLLHRLKQSEAMSERERIAVAAKKTSPYLSHRDRAVR